MKKLLRILSVFIFSSLVFLMFLTGSGIIRVKGAELGPRMEALDLHKSVNTSLGRLSVSGLDENARQTYSIAAPDADVDLEIVVFDDPDPVIAGTQIIYTVVITNNGPSEATNVEVINDFPPAQLSFISSTPEVCDGQGNIVTCTLGTLGIGLSTQFDLLMGVKSGATDPLLNPITVSSIGDTDLNPSNNSTTAATTIEYEYDLTVSKVDNVDPVAPDGLLIYTVTVDNTDGPSDANGVVLTDTLPIEAELVSIASSLGTCSDTVCTLGTLTAGNSANVIITTSVATTASGSIINTAQIRDLEFDTELANNITTETTAIEAPNLADLILTKSDSPDPVVPGGTLTYTINVTNNGPDDATSVVVTDTLPALVYFDPYRSDPSCTETNGLVTCNPVTLPASESLEVTLVTTVTQSTPVGTIITNKAGVSSPDDPTPSKVEEPTIVSTQVDLSVTKSAPPTVIAGDAQPLIYTVTVTNLSDIYEAPNVVITDTLPAGVTFVSSTPGPPDCTQAAGVMSCDLGTLPVDSSTDVFVTVSVDSDAVGPLMNYVETSSDAIDPNVGNNDASTQTTVEYSADLSITKVDDPDPVHPGETLTYTLTITNAGPSTATGVEVEDTLPAMVTFDSSRSDPRCIESDILVTCTIGTLTPSETDEVIIVVQVDPMAVGPLSNEGHISSDASDPNPANNESTISTEVVESADLMVSTTDFPEPADPGDELVYTLSVINNGPFDATNVVLTDTLPSEVTFVNSTPVSPTCSHSSGIVVCNLGDISQGDYRLVVLKTVIDESASYGTIKNTAVVSSDLFDPVSGNNEDEEYTTIGEGADLSLAKTGFPNPVVTGGILTYTLTVNNEGPLPATNVSLTDTLPVNVTFLSSTPGSPTCVEESGVVNCELGDMDPGGTMDVSIIVQAATSSIDPLINQATVESDTFDQDETNNDASITTTVRDIEVPQVAWVYPVVDKQRYDVRGEVVLLEVEATDNVAVERVRFFWWDYEIRQFVDIVTDYDTPYSVYFDTSILNFEHNEVDVIAYDTSGNATDRHYIWLYRLEYAWTQYLPLVSRR